MDWEVDMLYLMECYELKLLGGNVQLQYLLNVSVDIPVVLMFGYRNHVLSPYPTFIVALLRPSE